VVGAAAIARFSWVFYIFGAFLVYTAIRLARGSGPSDDDFHENAMIRRARRVLPISDDYDGAKLHTRKQGRWMFTPMVAVFLAIGSTDLLFALDSIPAIFGLTQDPFVVFTATLFALMGLRQLYFLLGGLLDRLVYLSTGLAIILGFIGVKLVFEALHENELPFLNDGRPVEAIPSIPISVSLGTIVVVLVVTTVASLLSSRAEERSNARANESGDGTDGRATLRASVEPVAAAAGAPAAPGTAGARAGAAAPNGRPVENRPGPARPGAAPRPVPGAGAPRTTRPAAPATRRPTPRYHDTRD
jgi:tellurite resistance protein TerC